MKTIIVSSCFHLEDVGLGLKYLLQMLQEDQGDSVARRDRNVECVHTLHTMYFLRSGMHLLLLDLPLRI